ncbi:hypothetical protein [Epilithonimonas arachidiradicis]|uniref:Uncharacterized protein n=1 Tax=Epilithonimonas arachidiradicis TaxID=1617282 RepID=A0A420DDN5_9FLAO|nr:hypothetical protein [Epilithonimonas arachidiradicis]RKE89679.1 hypothetical protein BXY58_0251 [Epilithonimonas arachidiradicis]GGG44411.1 hypothetical protein GCM10007332_02380 [Epilithonimonas arachidiradicis]
MKNQKRNIFEESAELVGWVQIFLSPFLISLVLAAIVHFSFDSIFATIISLLLVIIGILVGIKFANKIYKSKQGTIHFVSRTSASPELDKEENKIKE